jgi:hypothetical protein
VEIISPLACEYLHQKSPNPRSYKWASRDLDKNSFESKSWGIGFIIEIPHVQRIQDKNIGDIDLT